MNKLPIFGLLLIVGAILAVTGCGGATTSTNTTSPAASTATTNSAQEPVAVVSVIGPIPPINPGGPTIEITLKNVSTDNIVSLKAILGIGGSGPGLPPTYLFNVSSTAPLQPGKTVSSKLNIIGGGFSDNVSYPVTINGTLQGGKAFGYIVQVKISAPAQ